jgi:hypothetical protein
MSTFTLNIEKEFEAIEPEDALHIQRALIEMLKLARRKIPSAQTATKLPEKRSLPSFDMGSFMPGIDPHKLGQLPDEF